jgi:hypothetical protein
MPEFISITATSDALQLVRYFEEQGVKSAIGAKAATSEAAYKIKAQIQINASGPGPAVPNVGHSAEHYRDSYGVTMVQELNGGWSAVIGTDKPYGRRLEFGFADTDSLGRVYHQAPRPHMGPAVDKWAPEWAERLFFLSGPS